MRSYIFYTILLSFFILGLAGHWSRAEHGIAAFDFLNEAFKKEQPVIPSEIQELQTEDETELEKVEPFEKWADILPGGWEYTEDYNGKNAYNYSGGMTFERDGTFTRIIVEEVSGRTKSAIRIDGVWSIVTDTTDSGEVWREQVKTCRNTVSNGTMCNLFPKGKAYFLGLYDFPRIEYEIKNFTDAKIHIVGKDIIDNSEYHFNYKKVIAR